MAGGRRSRLRLFGTALLAGTSFRLGLPGLADVVEHLWNETGAVSWSILPAGWQGYIGLLGLLVSGLVFYLNYDVFFRGAKRGRKGLLITAVGFLAGVGMVQALIIATVG